MTLGSVNDAFIFAKRPYHDIFSLWIAMTQAKRYAKELCSSLLSTPVFATIMGRGPGSFGASKEVNRLP